MLYFHQQLPQDVSGAQEASPPASFLAAVPASASWGQQRQCSLLLNAEDAFACSSPVIRRGTGRAKPVVVGGGSGGSAPRRWLWGEGCHVVGATFDTPTPLAARTSVDICGLCTQMPGIFPELFTP